MRVSNGHVSRCRYGRSVQPLMWALFVASVGSAHICSFFKTTSTTTLWSAKDRSTFFADHGVFNPRRCSYGVVSVMARSINLKNWILLESVKIHSGIDEEPKKEARRPRFFFTLRAVSCRNLIRNRIRHIRIVLDLVKVQVLVDGIAGCHQHAHVSHVFGLGRYAPELGANRCEFG